MVMAVTKSQLSAGSAREKMIARSLKEIMGSLKWSFPSGPLFLGASLFRGAFFYYRAAAEVAIRRAVTRQLQDFGYTKLETLYFQEI